jgi:hypothetical protein
MPSQENKPYYIDEALNYGYDVEIDLWIINNELFLGHDSPETNINFDFITKRKNNIWCHAKNLDALNYLLQEEFNCFFHDRDDYTLTSKGIIWAYPGQKLNAKAICVMPERCATDTYSKSDFNNCYGICSDIVEIFRETYQNQKAS